MFFLRNMRNPKRPELLEEPNTEDMVKARERNRMQKKEDGDDTPVLPKLRVGNLVRGQNPKSKEWTMAGRVEANVHRDRAVFVKVHKKGNRMFQRKHV